MDQFPLFRSFISTETLDQRHYFSRMSQNDPILPAIEYFLTQKSVVGFDHKTRDFINRSIDKGNMNEGIRQWASVCAEFGAIRLIGKELGLPIIGFEQISPKAQNPERDCDIVAILNGKYTFFEVKRKGDEDSQIIPERLSTALQNFSNPYSLVPDLIKRDYDCSNLDDLLKSLENHINEFQLLKKEGLYSNQDTPSPFVNSEIEVHFLKKSDIDSNCQFFAPTSIEDIHSFLFETGRIGKDGKPMIPKVIDAEEKGADYLICRVPDNDPWDEIVDGCFKQLSYRNDLTFFTKDENLRTLSGIVLFAKYNNFCIINNLNSGKKNWLAV